MTHPAPGPARVRLTEGMTPYMAHRPPRGVLLRFCNEYNGQTWTGYADELHPESNACCMWWKLTGIARFA